MGIIPIKRNYLYWRDLNYSYWSKPFRPIGIIRIEQIWTTPTDRNHLYWPDQRDSVISDRNDSDRVNQNDSDCHGRNDSYWPGRNDFDRLDRNDPDRLDRNDSVRPEQSDSVLPDRNDSDWPDRNDFDLPVRDDFDWPDQADSDWPDRNDPDWLKLFLLVRTIPLRLIAFFLGNRNRSSRSESLRLIGIIPINRTDCNLCESNPGGEPKSRKTSQRSPGAMTRTKNMSNHIFGFGHHVLKYLLTTLLMTLLARASFEHLDCWLYIWHQLRVYL